ncbi:hypothetical protein CANINC_004298 [Pichia inconspicua]|uniref:Plus3 domain-containing protein n=1 Tax=Pichia inconspicua TaxID=52247 RepID=A0A4T0WWD1_9ASCO|nr:hypothetical protein CANINC_004298 [[Candida] inconspicua]
MSDSDDDLLELAGIGSEAESDYEPVTKKRTRPNKAINDDDDDDNDEDDDEDLKSLDVDDDPYPLEGKYKNQQDKEELMAMDEMTREGILYERIQEKEKYRERKFLALRARQNKAESKSIKTGSSTKKLKTSKLSELKKQRERKNNRDARRNRGDDEYLSDDAEQEDEDDDEDLRELAGYGDEDEDDGYYSDDYAPSTKTTRSRGGYDQSQYQEASFEQLDKIRSSRSVLEKFLYRDEFDTCIVGTLVRVNIGPNKNTGNSQYRIAMVDEVKRGGRLYKLSGKPCNTYLKISQGDSSTIMDISYLSNSPFTLEEYEIYKKKVTDSANRSMLTVKYVNEKFEELRKMATRTLTDADINKMIAKKEQLAVNEMNTANTVKRIGRLKEELQVALEQENDALVQKLKAEIDHLSTFFKTSNDSKLEQINLRNKKSNQEFIRKAEKRSVETRRKQLHSNDFSDPFSRLRTNPKVFYKSEEKSEEVSKREEAIVDEKAEKNKIKNSIFRREGIDALIRQIDIHFDIDL